MKNFFKSLFVILSLASCSLSEAQQETNKIIKRDISFTNDGLKLAGTLFIPNDTNFPVPAIVITHGSGKEGRHLRSYQYQANIFAEYGFATFIFDKRGIGESEDEYIEADDIRIPAGDLLAAVEVVKNQSEVDPRRIGVMGISQGGWVAPLAATLNTNIAFVVSFVGGGVSVKEQVLHHRKMELIDAGWSSIKIDSAISFARKLYTYLSTQEGYEELKDDYERAAKFSEWFSFIKAQGFSDKLTQPESLSHPWFKSLAYDPRETEEKINVPYLIVLGEKDKHVPTALSVKGLNSAFKKSGFKQYKIVVLPDERHQTFKIENGKVTFRDSFKEPLFEWLQQFKK